MKLTFVGDIACDKPLLKAAKTETGFDFSDVFRTEKLFSKSDYVIGNLEVCFAEGPKYAYKPYHYSIPKEFCTAIRNAGFNVLGMANNHCFDEDIEGIRRTLEVVEKNGLYHTGTFCGDIQEKRYIILEKEELKVAFFSLTDTVNSNFEASHCDDLSKYVNIIGFKGKSYSNNKFLRYLKFYVRPNLGKLLHKIKDGSTIAPQVDQIKEYSICYTWWDEIKRNLVRAKSEADFLIVLLHIGGQFNEEPGEFSNFIVDQLCGIGVDLIVGHHPHTIQKIEKKGKTLIAFSLGGFCMSPSGEYLVHDCLPEYGMVLHVELEKNKELSYTWDLIKGIEERNHYLHVIPVDELDIDKTMEKDILKLKNRIEGVQR
mgnify:CR=1 FL=1